MIVRMMVTPATRKASLIAAMTVAATCVGLPAHATTPLPNSTVNATTIVTLITGDRVIAQGNGQSVRSYAISPAAGDHGLVQSYQDANGDHYTIPTIVAPYLGRQLDQSLFDVSALVRDGITDKVPVTLSFAAGVTPTAPPGITLTSTTGNTADGYFTSASATAFTAALHKQLSANAAAHRPASSGGLLDGLTSMRLAAAAAPATAKPHFPLTDLQINAVDLNGQPGDGAVTLVNTDSVADAATSVPVVAGVGRVAVPAGHYFAVAGFNDFNSAGYLLSTRVVVVDDFTVAPTPAVNAVTLDERTATAKAGAITPRPATQGAVLVQMVRYDKAGKGVPFSLGNEDSLGAPLYITPMPAPKVGKLHYVFQWDGIATNAADNYTYDLAFPSDTGIPANETFTATDRQLATVTQHFDSDPPVAGNGVLYTGSTDPQLVRFGTPEVGIPLNPPMPGQFTEYLGTADGGMWDQLMGNSFPTLVFAGDPETYVAGRHYRINWAHGPLVPGFGSYHWPGQFCLACTSGSTLGLSFNQFNDSVASHAGGTVWFPADNHLILYWNDVKIADKNDIQVEVHDLATASGGTLRATLDTDASGVYGLTHATTVHTDVTMRVTGRDPLLSEGDSCTLRPTTTPCHILPALALNYDLNSDSSGASTLPVQTMRVDVSHLSYDGRGSHAPITSTTVSVSFDQGKTWQAADVHGDCGRYLARWSNPVSAKGTDPWLKVTATDADGGSISQTIGNAYTYTGSAS